MSVWREAKDGDLDGVKAAVKNGADIEKSGGWLKGTGLHYACYRGYFSIADYLLQLGAEVNSRNKDGSLPIHFACKEGHLDIVKLLKTKGSDFTSTNDYGYTPLHIALLYEHLSVADYLRGAEAAGNWC